MRIVTAKIRCCTGLMLLAVFLLVAVAAPVSGSPPVALAQQCGTCDYGTPEVPVGDGQQDQCPAGECCDAEERFLDPAVAPSPFAINIPCDLYFLPESDVVLPQVHLAIFVPPQS